VRVGCEGCANTGEAMRGRGKECASMMNAWFAYRMW